MNGTPRMSKNRIILLALTLMLSGRAMTLAFIAKAGSGTAGDPPGAWLMPLIGDAVIGVTALGVAYLVLRGKGLGAWTTIVVWNALGIWDAMSAFIVHQTVPWPEFFMIETFGSPMFFAAGALHLANLWLVSRAEARDHFIG